MRREYLVTWEIELDADRGDINFPVDYLIAIPSLSASAQTTGGKRPQPQRRKPAAAARE